MTAPPPSPGAVPFEQGHIHDRQATAGDILADFPRLREIAARRAATRSKWKTLMIVCIAVVIPLIFVAAVVPPLFPLPLAAVAGAIVFGILFFRIPRYDLRQFDAAEQIIKLVSVDAAADAPLHLHLDMRPHEMPEKLTGEGKAAAWDVKYYVSPWFTLAGRFLDGSRFDLRLITRFQARKKWKRSRSGKSKLKRKTKESLRTYVGLRIKAEKYVHVEKLAQGAAPAVKLPPEVRLHHLGIAAESLDLTVDANGWTATAPEVIPAGQVNAPHLVALMLLSLYQVLNLSKAIDKQGHAA
ncbi:MAG: hypothetical protein ABSH20_04245 [Tepidisphaeraceae bacterium]|jgi:hypothetical protein